MIFSKIKTQSPKKGLLLFSNRARSFVGEKVQNRIHREKDTCLPQVKACKGSLTEHKIPQPTTNSTLLNIVNIKKSIDEVRKE